MLAMNANAPRILVVDDDRKDLDRTLDSIRTVCSSYEARIAEGAFEGLDYLLGRGRFHERQRHPLPDLVLLDVGMAPLDGVQVLKRISEADYLRGIPVALMCATEAERQRAMRENVPACAFVVKPLSTESLRGLLLTAKYGPAALM
jgi:CheY-like chemotaxis protein